MQLTTSIICLLFHIFYLLDLCNHVIVCKVLDQVHILYILLSNHVVKIFCKDLKQVVEVVEKMIDSVVYNLLKMNLEEVVGDEGLLLVVVDMVLEDTFVPCFCQISILEHNYLLPSVCTCWNWLCNSRWILL
jgi:hypothetical protein